MDARTWLVSASTVLIAVLNSFSEVHAQEITETDHYFVEAGVDDETPYLGQHVTYTVKFFVAYPTAEVPRYRAPKFPGFVSKNSPTRVTYSESIGGHSYTVYQVSTVLYPKIAGNLSIGPATMTVPEESCIDWPSARNCPGAHLSPMERGGGLDQFEYTTRQLELAVIPPPSTSPKSFSGAVGRFEVRASVDAHSIKIGEPVTLAVTVTGEGNLESFPVDEWPQITDWRTVAASREVSPTAERRQSIETKIFSLVLIPQRAGNYTIPPILFSYFDPKKEQYVTESTAPIEVEVRETIRSADGGTIEQRNENGHMSVTGTTILEVRPVPSTLKRPQKPLTSSRLFWWAWITPIAVFMILATLKSLRILRKGS